MQGSSHVRDRPDANERNSEPLKPVERDGAEGILGNNFLGKAWCHSKGFKPNENGNYLYDYPSLNEIFMGIKLEATRQIEETSGCPKGSQLL
jgi:hypothetical protein